MPPPISSLAPTRTHHSLDLPSATVTRHVLLAESNNPTTTSSDFIQCTPSPSSCSTPNIVVIELATTLRIPDFARFYDTPIESFRPSYNALPDGSLVSSPLATDIRTANGWLLVFGATGVFFLLNSLSSFRYVREGHIKKKGLFYLLCCSQILGLMSVIAMLVPFFIQSLHCTPIGFVFRIGITLSYTLLMTGILGTKAYRCLNSSRVVLLILVILRLTMLALMGLDLSQYRGRRRLSGSCISVERSKIVPVLIVLQTVESLFICGCFLVAVWLTSRKSVDRGRLSIPVSTAGNTPVDGPQKLRRGWWDYVPNEHSDSVPSTMTKGNDQFPSKRRPSLLVTFSDKLRTCCGLDSPVPMTQEKLSKPERYGSRPQPTWTSSVVFAESPSDDRSSTTRTVDLPGVRAATPPPRPPSVMSRISKYMPRMKLLKKVLRDELLYTTFTTAIFLATACVVLVGVTCNFLLGPFGWLIFNWIIISAFTMHSFSRVVRRHEREAILQHPSAWDPMYRAELEAAKVFRQGRPRRAFSPVSVVSRRPRRTADWSSVTGLHHDLHNQSSLYSPANTERPSSSPSHAESRPWQTASQFSRGSRSISYTSRSHSAEHIPMPSHWTDVVVFPVTELGRTLFSPSLSRVVRHSIGCSTFHSASRDSY
ncbi:hypothetical protein QCA50_001707 [Cerrena zonata]|uniref:Uncharacterized protein n=1 Tax=Cerrena zonata TaxID=2478898 RepID=A0AAW0GM50_9APHY